MAVTKFRLFGDALRHLADARLATITDDVESQYALTDAYPQAVEFVLRQAAWRFALKTVPLSSSTGPLPGFTYAYAKPNDWLRTHALFVLNGDGHERPVDIREQGSKFSANLAEGIVLRFVSRDFLNPDSRWPEHFAQAVGAYLAFLIADRVTGEHGAAGRMSQLFSSLLTSAVEHDAIPEDRWLEFQLSGAFARCSPAVLARGWWRYCLKTIQLNAEAAPDQGGQLPTLDFARPYVFALPDDWFMTHALFINWNGLECPIDIKEHQHRWQTATPVFLARYMSTAVFDTTLWPDTLCGAILAYLELDETSEAGEQGGGRQGADPTQTKAGMFNAALQAAMEDESDADNPWLQHQLSGRFLQGARWVLEQGRWRFAIRSVELNENFDPLPGDTVLMAADGTVTTPAQHGYASRFIKPNDWLRTIWFGRQISEGLGMQHIDCDYIDEGLTLHANWSPLSLRYLSVERGLDPTQWTAHFRDGLLAYLDHIEARGDPKLAKFAAERFKFFQLQLREAEVNDDTRDGPVYRNVGRVVRARYGWGRGYGIGPGYGPAQGWWG